jgi:vacuolar protein sorting-associated protein 16
VDHLERNSAKADEDIRLIRPQLTEAVDGCISAAGYEWDHYWQKQLLKVLLANTDLTLQAASFGKAFLELYNSDQFVEMCRVLRVLNAVRDYKIGLPLSYTQYQKIGPEGVIERLMNRREHFLAVKICEYLEIPADLVYTNWACLKVILYLLLLK